jgi:hypothetical protein
VSSSLCDEVPHIFIQKSHLEPREFLISSAKRLLQHNLPLADKPSPAKIHRCPLLSESGHFGGTLVAKGVTIPWKDSVSHFLLSHCFYDGGGVLSGPPKIIVAFDIATFLQWNCPTLKSGL